ncbi:MAG: NAD-dependent epimerase/dehydratase family protein [Spirulina sp. SIO3F2]|nr:NAD-dependent epimerase/dehydratase family protein [Spirulina sp. SIO3F2]
MMNVLVTGSSGFIGRYLAAYLIRCSISVVQAVRAQPANTLSGKTIYVGNIDSHTCWETALENVDMVVHLAAYAHVLDSTQLDLDALYACNVAGTQNLVQACLRKGVKHFVFLSSIGAIADSSQTPLPTTAVPTPETPYGHSKLQAEQALIALTTGQAMTWTILRPPLVYGAGNPGNMARLQRLVQWGMPLPFANVRNQRSFIYIENLVDAIATCLLSPQAQNQIFHVSDAQALSTANLIRKIANHSGCPCLLFPLPLSLLRQIGRWGDYLGQRLLHRSLPFNSHIVNKLTDSLLIDTQYIQQTLAWSPPFTVDEGLARTFAAQSQ